MARALIIGCGRRGGELGERLLGEGWAVRGTTRREAGLAAIEARGIEAAVADLDRVGTVLEHVGDVAIVYVLLGSAEGDPAAVAALHGERLESLMEKLVDTPVRGVVYEAVGSVDPAALASGVATVRAAERTWRIPVEVVEAAPSERSGWTDFLAPLALGLLSARPQS